MTASAPTTGIDLYWLPLGADGHSVRLDGRIFDDLSDTRLVNSSPASPRPAQTVQR